MFSGRFWEELRERFPEMDDAGLKRFVGFRIFIYALVYIGTGLWIWLTLKKHLAPAYSALFLVIWVGLQDWVQRKAKRKWPGYQKKLKGTLLRKMEVAWALLVAALYFVWLIMLFQDDTMADNTRTFPSAEAGVRAYGQEVELPTYVPFTVKSTESEIDGDGDLYVAYYSDTSRFGFHFAPLVELWISRTPPDMPKEKKLKLKNGAEAVFGHSVPEEPELVWQSHGFWYELTMQRNFSEFSEQDFIKVADSFRPYKSLAP